MKINRIIVFIISISIIICVFGSGCKKTSKKANIPVLKSQTQSGIQSPTFYSDRIPKISEKSQELAKNNPIKPYNSNTFNNNKNSNNNTKNNSAKVQNDSITFKGSSSNSDYEYDKNIKLAQEEEEKARKYMKDADEYISKGDY